MPPIPPTTSVPPIVFTPQGPIIPPDSDILAGVQVDMNTAFGGGLNPALETPQGQLASSTAAIISDKDAEIALICNQVDPQYATGRFQDAIARIYFLTRKPATSTAVTCNLSGLSDTTVPAGTLAQDTEGNTYVLLGDADIPVSGAVSSSWANIATGPIPCPAGTLIRVYQAVPGWDTITNPTDGVLGQNVESPSEFEFRRQQSVALNGQGTTDAILANVFAVANVLDCYVIDNPKGIVVDKGSTNYPMLPHSLYVAVVGGLDADIAQAIWGKKDTGCDYNGNTSETVLDMAYDYPQPSYEILFERPAPLAIKFAVQIVNNPSLAANTTSLIQAAIVARFNGTNGTARERIAGLIIAANYYGPVSAVGSNVIPISILVGTTSATLTSQPVGIDQVPTLSLSDITVMFV